MAITVSFPAANITTDLTLNTITVVDGSTYGSPARTTLGVFVKLYKTDYTGARTYLTTTANNTDPASASTNTWTATYTADGWHTILYVAAPAYSGGTTYAQYDLVYDSTTKLAYRSKSAGNLGNALVNTTFWEFISDPSSIALNVGTSTQSVNLNAITSVANLNFGITSATKVALGTQTGLAFLEGSSTFRRGLDVRNYEILDLAVEDMKFCDSRQNYSALEIAARRAASVIANL